MSSDLLQTFLLFVSAQDREILLQALSDFWSVESDELLDVLSNYECRSRVISETLKNILLEIAHKELVQKPMFVLDWWKDVVMQHIGFSNEELINIVQQYKPTAKKVTGLLHFPQSLSTTEREVQNHLKRFIRELNEEKLGRFLRFTTGSDNIVCDKIEVMFTHMSAFTRRTVRPSCSTGRICGCILELANTYHGFPDFRSEFNAVLERNIWIIDIA